MNRISVGLLTLALLGCCYAAPHDTGKPHVHKCTDEAPGIVYSPEHDDVYPCATDEERPGPGAASFTREKRDLPRPSRPREENDEENNSGTRNLPRPSQISGDENEEGNTNTKDLPRPGQGATDDDSDQTLTKDISRPSSGIQTLPARIPEGFRISESEKPVSTSSTRVARDLPRPNRPGQEDNVNDSLTKELPRPSQNGGDDPDEEDGYNTKELPRPGQGATDDDSNTTGTKDISKPSSGIQTLPARIPEGFRISESEKPVSTSSTRVARDLPRPNRPGQEDDENDSRTKDLPRPSQNGGDDQDGEDGNDSDDDSDQKGTKDISRPSSGIQTLPAKVPEGFRPNGREEDEEEEEESEE